MRNAAGMTRKRRARVLRLACTALVAVGDAGAVGLGSHTLLGHEDGNSPPLATNHGSVPQRRSSQ